MLSCPVLMLQYRRLPDLVGIKNVCQVSARCHAPVSPCFPRSQIDHEISLKAAMRGALDFGESKLKARTSPSWSRTNDSVSFTALSIALARVVNAHQAIDSVSASNSSWVLGNRTIKKYQRTHFWVGQSIHAEVF